MSSRDTVNVIFAILAVIFFISVILFGCSYKVIEVNQIGLYKNKYSVNVEENKVYKSGRYFVGLAGTFIKYSSTWQYITFSDSDGDAYLISAKTSDPSTVKIEATLTYRLREEFIYKLYEKYPSQNHHKDMVNSAKDIIQKVCTNYKYNDFFQNRITISDAISQQINEVFKDKYYCEMTLFLLREIVLEDQFESTLISTQVNKRKSITAVKQQQLSVLDAEIEVIESLASIQVNQLLNEAQAVATEYAGELKAQGDQEILNAEAEAYAPFKTELGFSDSDLLRFLYLIKVQELSSSTVYAGFPETTLFSN